MFFSFPSLNSVEFVYIATNLVAQALVFLCTVFKNIDPPRILNSFDLSIKCCVTAGVKLFICIHLVGHILLLIFVLENNWKLLISKHIIVLFLLIQLLKVVPPTWLNEVLWVKLLSHYIRFWENICSNFTLSWPK